MSYALRKFTLWGFERQIMFFMESEKQKLILGEKSLHHCQIEESKRINVILTPEAYQCSWLSVRAIISCPSNTFLHHGPSLYGKVKSLSKEQNGEKIKKTTKLSLQKLQYLIIQKELEWNIWGKFVLLIEELYESTR